MQQVRVLTRLELRKERDILASRWASAVCGCSPALPDALLGADCAGACRSLASRASRLTIFWSMACSTDASESESCALRRLICTCLTRSLWPCTAGQSLVISLRPGS